MQVADARGAPPPRPGPIGGRSWWRSPRAWWATRTPVQRVELYTEQVLYWLGAIAPLLLLVLTGGTAPAPVVGAVVLASLAQGASAFVVLRAGLRAARRHEARAGLAALALTTAAVLGLALALPASSELAASPRQAVVAYSVLFSPAALCVLHPRAGWLVPLGAGAAVGASALLNGSTTQVALTTTTITLLASAFLVMTLRLSLWLLDVVHQLADAQGDRARLAVAEERLRFARDLHDVVGRDLSAIALKSEVVARMAERGRPEAVTEALAVRELAQSSLAEVRAVVRGHRRADLDVELAGARSLLRSAGVACELRVAPGAVASLPAPAQEALAWAVREAVTNVVRHARATGCAVSLQVVEGTAVLVVRNDDGPPDRAAGAAGALRPGAGLTGLRERLEVRGGSLQVRREQGRVVLTAQVPVAGAVAAGVADDDGDRSGRLAAVGEPGPATSTDLPRAER